MNRGVAAAASVGALGRLAVAQTAAAVTSTGVSTLAGGHEGVGVMLDAAMATDSMSTDNGSIGGVSAAACAGSATTGSHNNNKAVPTGSAASPQVGSVFRPGLFDGKVILVTGGGTGIGQAIALELASLGATVVIAGRREGPLNETVALIEEAVGDRAGSQEVVALAGFNIRNEESVAEGIEGLVARFGRLDGLVNNAGGQFSAPAAYIRPKGWRAVVDTNLNGTWWVSQAAFHATRAASDDAPPLAIVNIVADVWNGFPLMAHTSAARAGVINMTKTLAVEWGPLGVRVNAVAPGIIISSGIDTYPKDFQGQFLRSARMNPTERGGTVSEVASAVTFLLSPAGVYVNGETVRVDGAGSLKKGDFIAAADPSLSASGSVPQSHHEPYHLTADMEEYFEAMSTADIIKSKL